MSSFYDLLPLIPSVLIAWIVLFLPIFAGLVCASVFQRHLPLLASFGFAIFVALAGFPLSEILSRAMSFGRIHTWLMITGLVASSAAINLSALVSRGEPPQKRWGRAALVGLCGAPGLLWIATRAEHPILELGWALALVAAIGASARETRGAEAARRDAGALLFGASLGAWVVGVLPAGAAASLALAAAVAGWRPQALQIGAVPLLSASVCASNLQWYIDLVGTPLEAEIYAKLMGPLPRGADLSGRVAIERHQRIGIQRWMGLPWGLNSSSLLAASDMPLSALPGSRFLLTVAEDNEIFGVSFETGGYGVMVERLADGRFGVAGMPARASWSGVHADLREAFAGCKAGHGGVMFDPRQPWTVGEAVSVCLSARNLIHENASCTINTQRKPGCRFAPIIGWHPVCQDSCAGRSMETWEVLSSAYLTLELLEGIDGHVICPEGGCNVTLLGAGAFELECPDDSCTARCSGGHLSREGPLWRCDADSTSGTLLASP